MKSENRHLIQDLFDDESAQGRREPTLLAGRKVLRHRRHRRLAIQILAIAAIIGLSTVALQRLTTPRPRVISVPPETFHVRYINDDELLNLFPPDTPVGLATLGGKKRLVFPRPGDEQRFVKRF